MEEHREELAPELRATWLGAGGKPSGTWSEAFGSGPAGQEVFMAWHFARYTEAVAAAGKREHPLPMFVNAALIRPGHQPGQYPSAGPLPHPFDVWRAAAPSIDFLAPDIYFQNFSDWARRYKRSGNPLSFRKRCVARRRRSTGSTRSARTTRSASHRSASSRSATQRHAAG